MIACPVCETPNAPGSAECAGCGKLFFSRPVEVVAARIDGLEQTRLPEAGDGGVERLAEVEPTQLAPRDLVVAPDPAVALEPTRLQDDPAAPTFWTPGAVDVDRGREADDGERTLPPLESEVCPYCGAQSPDAVCDGCGRRKARYTSAPERQVSAPSEETVLCPACFAKVPGGPRCVECGVPFAVHEL